MFRLSDICLVNRTKWGSNKVMLTHTNFFYTVCLNKKETGTNIPVSLKLDKHLNNFGCYLLRGYLLFSTVPRNVGSISVNDMSVNEHKHFKESLTIWICTKILRLRLNWYLWTFFPKPVCNLLQANSSIPFSHNENSLLFCELHHGVFWEFKSASTVTTCIASSNIWKSVWCEF